MRASCPLDLYKLNAVLSLIDNFFKLIVTDFGLCPYPEHIPSITGCFIAYTYIILDNLYKILFSSCALSLLFSLSQRIHELTINHN